MNTTHTTPSTSTATPATIAERAVEEAKSHAARLGVYFALHTRNDLVEVVARFDANDSKQYVAVESAAYSVLRHFRQTRPGSTWGSTSDGVGGHAALVSGQFHLCKSGIAKRELRALEALVG